ncbi:MAG: LPS-assembly protein LptD precursor [Syntrophorhabdus sp. PtaU1.Bin058]|nr:MAG: LPS-assembly protein LptD precursor [Syntrophorhabdus sp. PtaU1.Bin058]
MRYFKRKIIILLFLFIPLSLYGKQFDYTTSFTAPIDISAMSVEYNREKSTYVAKGKVDLREGTRTLNADYVFFDENTQDIFAEGNVVFQDEGDRIECQKLQINLISKKGKIDSGRIYLEKGNFHITGEEIEKVGESQYTVKKGEFTTCGWEDPAWKFSAKDVDVTVEGYAKTKGTKFYIKDYPVFYLPWGIFPVKTERQSGLLMPGFAASSRNGMIINTSYFWAISKDKDATFFLDYLGDRGIKPGVEFRYAPKEDTKGVWDYSIISDRQYDGTRWQLKGQHEQILMHDIALKANLRFISDNDYLKDFGTAAPERSETLIKSTAFMEVPAKKSLLTAEVANFRNLLSDDNNKSTFQYYPHASFFTEYIPIFDGKLYTDFVTDYTSFYRDKGDKASRLGIEPRLRLPYSWNGINFLFNGTLMETAYLINRVDGSSNDTKYRHTFRIEGDMNTQFMRYYYTDMLDLGEMHSVIKPVVKYNFIPNTSFTDLPNIDPYDRLYQTNTITYGLNHYLNSTSEGWQRELSLFEISQTYGLSGGLRPSDLYKGYGGRFSDIDAKLTIAPTTNLSYSNEMQISTGGEGLKTIRNGFSYKKPNIYDVNLSHNYTADLNNEVFLDLGGIYKYFRGRYQVRYTFKDSEWIDTLYQLSYMPGCWGTTLTLMQSKRPNDTTIRISFDLTGITTR